MGKLIELPVKKKKPMSEYEKELAHCLMQVQALRMNGCSMIKMLSIMNDDDEGNQERLKEISNFLGTFQKMRMKFDKRMTMVEKRREDS